MEWKIGEIRQIDNEWYQCIVGNGCKNCAFYERKCYNDNNDPIGDCCAQRRKDNKDVIFKKLEKVGEPYTTYVGKTVQNYLLETAVSVPPENVFVLINNEQRLIAIEIKQNKENMEENKTPLPKEDNALTRTVYAYVNGKISDKELIRSIKEMSDEYPYDKNNLKPFSLEAAKSGRPVCTRDGRKARIICFDAKFPKTGNIVTLVEKENGEEVTLYHYDDGHCSIGRAYALMMLPEKKEGWVNVYKSKDTIFKSEKEAKAHSDDFENYIATVKIEWEE